MKSKKLFEVTKKASDNTFNDIQVK